jgi:hypothetical protein
MLVKQLHPLHYTLFYPVVAHIVERVRPARERKGDLDSLTFRKQMVLFIWKTLPSGHLKTLKLVVNKTILRMYERGEERKIGLCSHS